MLIDIVVYDGLDEMDALAPLEVSAAPVKPALMSRRPHRVVLGDYGLRFLADSVRVAADSGTPARLFSNAPGNCR